MRENIEEMQGERSAAGPSSWRSPLSRQRTCAVRSGVSKDGRESVPCAHPSRRLLRKLLRMRSVFSGRLWGAASWPSRRMSAATHGVSILMARDGARAPPHH